MNIIHLDEVDSTNNYIKSRCRELPDKTAVTALRQTSGRGRLGHIWEGDEGMLPLSILLKDPPEPENLSARAGLAVCEALESALHKRAAAGIKWPNDIILANRKVCGILCESVRFGDSLSVICGIGVNIAQSADYFRQVGLPNGGSIYSLTGEKIERQELLRSIVGSVISRCAKPFSDCFAEYERRVLNIGREVRIIRGDDERTAFAEGISERGFLICRDGSGVFEVSSGEVSVRGKEGYI